MRGKLLFVTGAAVGYVLGTRAGRKRYDQMKSAALKVWESPGVQKQVNEGRRDPRGRLHHGQEGRRSGEQPPSRVASPGSAAVGVAVVPPARDDQTRDDSQE